MEDMAQEFGDMLKETLDRMRERIEVRPTLFRCIAVLVCGCGTPRIFMRPEVDSAGKSFDLPRLRTTSSVRLLSRQRRCRKQQVNSTGFDADDSIPLQRRLEEVSLATLAEAPHK